jgi:hypothetical protein
MNDVKTASGKSRFGERNCGVESLAGVRIKTKKHLIYSPREALHLSLFLLPYTNILFSSFRTCVTMKANK